jgi:hypothetical protein
MALIGDFFYIMGERVNLLSLDIGVFEQWDRYFIVIFAFRVTLLAI